MNQQKKICMMVLVLLFGFGLCQKPEKAQSLKDKFEKTQPQDLSVPLPPVTAFAAQYPKGNKVFIEEVKKNIDKTKLNSLPKELSNKIILKIDTEGNVINISTYGKNDIFNSEVKKAVEKTTKNVIWEAGKNNRGTKVIDIVSLPFKYRNR